MYKLIEIKNSAVTRELVLENLNTLTIDVCFDDSMLVGKSGYKFLKTNDIYLCKIVLFDARIDLDGEEFYVNKRISIGKKQMFEVINLIGDIYYLLSENFSSYPLGEKISVHYTRKDLMQVNNFVNEKWTRNWDTEVILDNYT